MRSRDSMRSRDGMSCHVMVSELSRDGMSYHVIAELSRDGKLSRDGMTHHMTYHVMVCHIVIL